MSFSVSSLNPLLEQTIRNCGFTVPPSIQQQAISPIHERHDFLSPPQTGPAFARPPVQQLKETSAKQVKVFILVPARELAAQINEFINTIIRNIRLCCVAVRFAMRRNSRKQHPAFGRGQRVLGTLSLGVNLLAPQAFLDLSGDRTNRKVITKCRAITMVR